ncbi:MAG: tetratricopeptide repeat protein, partial [Spirochaetales bacterium]|nr:tetratricopeptide repeat protein [Spirochaetales bacterium]
MTPGSCRARAALAVAVCFFMISPVAAQQAQKADPRASYKTGLALMEAGDLYRAADAFMEAVTLNPAYGDAWAALARCQYELGEYERAVTYVGTAYAYGPRSSSLLTLHAFSLIGIGRLDGAR